MSEIIDFTRKKQELTQQLPDHSPISPTAQQANLERVRTQFDAKVDDPEVRAVLNRIMSGPKVIAFDLPRRDTLTPEEFQNIAQLIVLSLLLS